MANILGKVFMTPKDEWVLSNTYEKLDIVTVTGESETSAYIAKEDIPANTQITDDKWMKLFTVTDGTNGINGEDGAPGTAAGFGTPTATIDNNTGIPSVTVTASGNNTSKVFNFEFKNLKGETGPTGANGKDGAPGAAGADGKSITAITLTKDSTGAITGGTATLSDQSQVTITVTTEETT